METKTKIYRAVGRHKTSVAQVILKTGTGHIIFNKQKLEDYLPYDSLIQNLKQPLDVVADDQSFDIEIKVRGGGFSGQTGAARLGISRSLLKYSDEYRPLLRAAGLLTRDARIKERKKYGLRKARKARQFSKR